MILGVFVCQSLILLAQGVGIIDHGARPGPRIAGNRGGQPKLSRTRSRGETREVLTGWLEGKKIAQRFRAPGLLVLSRDGRLESREPEHRELALQPPKRPRPW